MIRRGRSREAIAPALPTTRPPMRAAGFTDPSFARLADLAHLLAGLVFPSNRQPSAEAGMRRAMATLRISDPQALLRAAETPGDARNVVLAELTVGESYFFRDAAQLDLLATDILPARAASADASRPLRVWSAGCASGEEPYTIAIMLRELAWTHGAGILGTDVALPRLEAAKRGRYTRWALRGVSEERVSTWFHRNGSYFDLDRSVRESVQFNALNLVHDDYSTDLTAAGGYDLVLCRNVMIYFDLPTVARIAAGLLASLAPQGWLVLGASDPPLADLVSCDTMMTPSGIAYRRAGDGHRSETSRSFAALRTTVPDPEPIEVRAPVPRPERSEGPALLTLPELPADDDISSIRSLANEGRLHEAGELCARALETHPLTAELHCLHATLLAEAGWHADAAIAARRSIYLDRKLVLGHLLLGDALTRIGDPTGARIAFTNVVALLEHADPTVPIAAADGVPATRLRQIATLRLRTLAGETPS